LADEMTWLTINTRLKLFMPIQGILLLGFFNLRMQM